MALKGSKHCDPAWLAAEAPAVVERLRAGATVRQELARCRCGHDTLRRAVLSVIPPGELAAIILAHRRAAGLRAGFAPGHPAHNGGVKGWSPPGSSAGWFKPGCLRGMAARNWRPIHTIVVRVRLSRSWHAHSAEYKRTREPRACQITRARFIKVADACRPAGRNWIPYAAYVWQQARGPVPAGRFVAHLDGDSLNDDLANLALMDHRSALAHTERRRPDVVAARRRKASGTMRRRHAERRTMKAGMAEIRRSALAGVPVGGSARPPRPRRAPMCAACGGDRTNVPTDRPCPKCGGYAIEE